MLWKVVLLVAVEKLSEVPGLLLLGHSLVEDF